MYDNVERINMKKIILAMTILALAGSQVQTAKAGGYYGGGWPIAAGVAGGLAVGTAIGATVARPVYYAPGYSGYYNYNAPAYPYYNYGYNNYPYYQQPAAVYAPPVYVAPPVVSFGFGFGRPYYGGYYGGYRGGYYGRYYGRGGYYHRGRW